LARRDHGSSAGFAGAIGSEGEVSEVGRAPSEIAVKEARTP